jgi:predicted DNA-binding transcriptional regulator YafY
MVPANQPLLAPRRNADIEAVVYEALLEGRQLDVRYGRKAAVEKCIHPLGLVQRGPVTYLVARYEGYDNVMILAMHRIHSATKGLAEARPPEGFTLADYVNQGAFGFYGSNEQIRLSLLVNPAVARILEETPLAADQSIEPRVDASVVTATVHDNAVLKSWLLSLGKDAQVLAPASLRASVARTLDQAARLYA